MAVSTATELWRLGAVELATLIASRQASCVEVVDAHLRRIQAANTEINAVVIVLAEEALEAAAAADRAIAPGAALQPLHGVPFTVKQNIDVAGTPTTQGYRALSNAYPARDAPAVERLKAAGAIVLGRTNLPTGAMRWHCESELWGVTLNPWDRSRTPGASSAGEAAAIATGMSPLGLGNDGLGSLRHPAQCCGVTALKPTLGRVPQDSTVASGDAGPIGIQLTGVTGPLARRVADLRQAFHVIAGPTWRDPWSVPVGFGGPDLAPPIHVAVVLDPGGLGTAAPVQDGVRAAATALADAGYAVEEREPDGIDAAATALVVMDSTPGIRAVWERMAATAPDPVRRFATAFFASAGEPDGLAVEESFVVRHAVRRAWGQFQESHPLIVAPIATEMPSQAGTDLDEGHVAADIRAMRMATAVNALGLPAVAVPVGVADGLPLAVQVIGPPYREDLALDAAQAIEDRLGVLTPIDPR
ncbi:MAG TPA: amidase [Candidatus Limnocylindria bacterium]|nr:amidase [Candidatus Limnocylindria bacterium]